MSDSESDASPSIPSDPKLEQCLRQVISRFFKSSKQDELTVRRVRTEAEQELKLSKAFFKSDAKWKDKSQEIIGDEVVRISLDRCCDARANCNWVIVKAGNTPRRTLES